MKYLFILICFASCCSKNYTIPEFPTSEAYKENLIVASQSDSTMFERTEQMRANHHAKPKLVTEYKLKNPQVGAYYKIYNPDNLLVKEGIFEDNKEQNYLGFLNFREYYYDDCDRLEAVHIQKEENNLRRELYGKNGELKEIWYYRNIGTVKQKDYYKNGEVIKSIAYDEYLNKTIIQ